MAKIVSMKLSKKNWCLPLIFVPLISGVGFAAGYKEEAAAERHANIKTTGAIHKPKELPPPKIEELKVPKDFKIQRIGENLGNLRVFALSDAGKLYVTRRTQSDVLLLKTDESGNPTGEYERVVGHPQIHGITFHAGKVYIATVHEILSAEVLANGKFGELKTIVRGLPHGGQHHTRTVRVGPDNMLYISAGSTCNECNETNQENATILRASLDGQSRAIFAKGLRDTIGWDWQPETGLLWGMDHGIDWFGDDMPEELNLIEGGKHYGWPFVYADNKLNPHQDPAPGLKKSEYLKVAVPMKMGYTGHSAPMQMQFYNSTSFPKDFEGDAFVAMHGSWNASQPTGYEVVRINFEGGQAKKIEPFVTGFLSAKGETGRPCALIVLKNGNLLFSDDRNGTTYLVTYTGNAAERSAVKGVPGDKMLEQGKANYADSLAIQKAEFKTAKTFKLESVSFKHNAMIPVEHSAYHNDSSPELKWSGAPAETKSYVLLMEDPDVAKNPKPFLHWIVWNIPASEQELRRGLPGDPRLDKPEGLRQGDNFSGKSGYMGPKPPEENKIHNYHFQMFALDTELNLELGTDRDKLLQAMKGHVIAKAELIGKFKKPAKPLKP